LSDQMNQPEIRIKINIMHVFLLFSFVVIIISIIIMHFVIRLAFNRLSEILVFFDMIF
jgi:cell division protein FtsL